jgi:hypothetical protein
MRVSDAERERTLEELARHCRDGRIDVDDYAHRVERVLQATDLGQLDECLADLPMMRIAVPRVGVAATAARWRARLVVCCMIVVLVVAVVLAIFAQWVWTLVLLAGWFVGLLQGRVGRRR